MKKIEIRTYNLELSLYLIIDDFLCFLWILAKCYPKTQRIDTSEYCSSIIKKIYFKGFEEPDVFFFYLS